MPSITMDIAINTLDPAYVDWDVIAESMKTAWGNNKKTHNGDFPFGNIDFKPEEDKLS